MGKYKPKTTVTAVSVDDYIASIDSETRRADARALLQAFGDATGWKPRMWGPSIIGFGAYHYTYESGHSGSICAAGFSPRKANFAIYVADFPGKEQLLQKLGKHKGGLKQCLYINKVADIDLASLQQIVRQSLVELRKQWPVTDA